MPTLLHDVLLESAAASPGSIAVVHRREQTTYAELTALVDSVARALLAERVGRGDRVAFYLPKRIETVATMFGALRAGGAFVPINPLLKPEQVVHVLKDSGARVLVTTEDRHAELRGTLGPCDALTTVVLLDRERAGLAVDAHFREVDWADFVGTASQGAVPHARIDADMAAILYTSGSTGKPKGVVLSHRNMVDGREERRELPREHRRRTASWRCCPFSFDYGFSQLSTAFLTGARVVLMDYLLPRDVCQRRRAHGDHGTRRRAAAVDAARRRSSWPDAAVATPALHHELRRRDAAGDARDAARQAAEHEGRSSCTASPRRFARRTCRPSRSTGGRTRSARRSRTRRSWSCARTARRCAPRRARRARASRRARVARLLERSGEDGRALSSRARARTADSC